MTESTHTFFFDRQVGQLHGRLTLQCIGQDKTPVKLFSRMPAASGQYPYINKQENEWAVGKGPIPFGAHYLSTKKEPLQMEPKGTPFYPIGSKPGSRIIAGSGGKQRTNVGLHLENKFPGSAGCVVLLHDTFDRLNTANELFAYLDKLYAEGVHTIPFVVL